MAIMDTMLARRPEPVNDMEEELPPEGMEAEEPEEAEESEGGTRIPQEVAAEIVKALQKPGVKKAVLEAAQSEDPSNALSGLAYGMIEGLEEKSGGSIPPEAMPDIAMEIVEMLSGLAAASAGGGDEVDLQARVMNLLLEKSAEGAQRQMAGRQQGAPEQPTGVQ